MDKNTKAAIKYAVLSALAILLFNVFAFLYLWLTTDLSSGYNFNFNDMQFSLNGAEAGLAIGTSEFGIAFLLLYVSLLFRAVKTNEINIKAKR